MQKQPVSAMMTRPIPSSGEALPVIGLGTYRAFDVSASPHIRDQLDDVLKLFFAAGGTLIDSSPMYGKAEAVAGDLLSGMQAHDQAFIATKVWTRGERQGIAEMDFSLSKLQCRSIDLMQVHNLVDCATHLKTLRRWKEEGKIRYLGITHYTTSAHQELIGWLKREPIDFVQFPYSIAVRDAEGDILPAAADLGVATLINRPFEQGGLFNRRHQPPLPAWAEDYGCHTWSQFFLKYLLSHPAVTCAIPATSNPAHMRDNLAAAAGLLPDQAGRRRMAAYFDSL